MRVKALQRDWMASARSGAAAATSTGDKRPTRIGALQFGGAQREKRIRVRDRRFRPVFKPHAALRSNHRSGSG